MTYRDHSVADVLGMTVDDAAAFLADVPAAARSLETLRDVGLGYLRLGQPATELSGGEAQRIKLATELQRARRGHALYLLDEPTTGLHPADIALLLRQLHRLVDAGNTVVLVEHDLDTVATADWVIDLGPGGGDRGGRVVATGHARRGRRGRRAAPPRRTSPRGSTGPRSRSDRSDGQRARPAARSVVSSCSGGLGRGTAARVAVVGVLGGQRPGDALQRLALGLDAEERRDDAAGDHQRGADVVAERDRGDAVATSTAFSMSLPKSSGPAMPPAAVPMA